MRRKDLSFRERHWCNTNSNINSIVKIANVPDRYGEEREEKQEEAIREATEKRDEKRGRGKSEAIATT